MSVQLELFTEEEVNPERRAAKQAAADLIQARADWAAKFTRADWVAPRDTAGGMKKGDSVPGWVCPACGVVEVNTYLLHINHGYDPDVPGDQPYTGWEGPCHHQTAVANHKIYDDRRAAIRQLAAEGLDDEQIAARIDVWDAATVAIYRKDDAKEARAAAKAAKKGNPA